MNLSAELKKRTEIVNEALDKYLPPGHIYPELIHRSMRYSVLSGGKRLRPIMVMAGAESVGGDPLKVLPAACAVELLHTYSLVHDDLPAMDNDDYRRGKLTNHKKYGEATAILTGDALLTYTFQLMTENMKEPIDPVAVIKSVGILSKAAGTMGLIGGQVVDTLSSEKAVDYKTLKYIHSHKTGRLFQAALVIGSTLAGGKEKDIAVLNHYGENFGLAFQIVDDILDIEGDSDKIGKPTGSDRKNQKATYPSLLGLEEARVKARGAVAEAADSIKHFGAKAEFLHLLAHHILSRDR